MPASTALTSPRDLLRGRLLLSASLLCIGLLFGALRPATVAAQGVPPELAAGSSDTVAAIPGQRTTLAFRLKYGGSDSLPVRSRLEVPELWEVVTASSLEKVAPNSSRVLLVALHLPEGTPPGIHQVNYRLSRPSDSARVIASASRQVRVEARPQLEARLLDVPRQIGADEVYDVRLRVTNAGNVPLEAALDLRGHGRRVRAGRNSLHLQPGRSEVIGLTVEGQSRPASMAKHVLEVRVTAQGDTTVTAVATGRVPVLSPSNGGSGRSAPEFQSRITTRAATGGESVAPLEVRGSGPVPLGAGGSLTYMLRGPQTGWGSFGLADEYWASLETRQLDIRLGDRSYGLSRLTEPGRFGFGGSVDGEVGGWSLGGFYATSRRGGGRGPEWGAFATVEPTGGLGLQLNFLDRAPAVRETASGMHEEPARLASVEADVRLGEAAVIHSELARGFDPGRAAGGYAFDVSGDAGALSYHVGRKATGSGYPRPIGDIEENSAQFSVDLSPSFRADGFYQDYEAQARTPLFRDSTPGHRGFRKMGGRVGLGTLLSIEADRTLRVREAGLVDYRLRSDALSVRSGLEVGEVEVHADGEIGRVRDLARGGTDRFFRVGTEIGFATLGDGRFRLGAEGFRGRRLFEEQSETSVRTHFYADFPIGRHLDVSASGQGRWYLDRGGPGNGLLRARASYRLPFGHEIALRTRIPVGSSYGSRGVEAMAEYSVGFGFDFEDETPQAELTGRVYEMGSDRGVGRVGISVRGRRTFTDADGTFRIRGLEPGRHYLRIDPSTLNPALTPITAMPRLVRVDESPGAGIRVGVARAVDVRGRVGVEPDGPRARRSHLENPKECEPLEGAVVSLQGADQTYTTMTDSAGRFSFEHFSPGRWSLEIRAADLPPHHAFETSEVALELAPGEERNVELCARAEVRQIRVIDQMEVTGEGPTADPRGH